MSKIITYANSNKVVTLTDREKFAARLAQKQLEEHPPIFQNSTGAEIDITTLTAVVKSVSEQKFFEIAPADFIPVVVGEGQFASELLKFRSFQTSGSFADGVINTAAGNARLASADAAVDAIKTPIINWAKQINWSLFDLEQASRAGNWDLILQKEKSRKKNWDLGIQSVAFLGLESDDTVEGLLSLSNVNSNTTVIQKLISTMTEAEFQALLANILEAYRANGNRTAYPTHFIIPEVDYNGLANSVSENFALKSRLQRLQEAFVAITQNPNFKILPLAYGNASINTGTQVGGLNRYVLLRYDEDTLAMNIPLNYTGTLAQTVNNFQYQNVAYGQFTGVKAFRAPEILYFDWS